MASEAQELRCNMKGSDLESQPIEVVVGPHKRRFYVHTPIVSRSAFFKKALEGEWKESQQRAVSLPEDEPDVFAEYLIWVYTGRLHYPPLSKDNPDCYYTLAKFCALAEKLLDDEFMDHVLDTFVYCSRKTIEGTNLFPGAYAVRLVYDSTPPLSPARKLMVDMYVSHGTGDFKISEIHGTEFLVDAMQALLEVRPGLSPEARKQRYGQLDNGVPCSYHKRTCKCK